MRNLQDTHHLLLNYIGSDYFVRPVYKDQYGNLWLHEKTPRIFRGRKRGE